MLEVIKVRERLITRNLIKKYEKEPDGQGKAIMYRKRLAMAELRDLYKDHGLDKTTRDNIFSMIKSPDAENLTVAETIIQQIKSKTNG